jgi:hypothetical protein
MRIWGQVFLYRIACSEMQGLFSWLVAIKFIADWAINTRAVGVIWMVVYVGVEASRGRGFFIGQRCNICLTKVSNSIQ